MSKIHLICNAHLDPVWQWDWQEGACAALSTFSSAVELAEEFDYIFCHGEVTLYKFIEEYSPALFEKIQKYSFSDLDKFGTSTLITRLTGDINQVQVWLI